MAQERHEILGGKAYLYRRVENGRWQCATFLDGHNHRTSTGETNLALAVGVAENWYFKLRGYAAHIKSSISAKAVNVRTKALPKKQQEELERRNRHRFGKTEGEKADT